jgi:hypothetical protein
MVRIFETTFDGETPLTGASTIWARNDNAQIMGGAAGADGGVFRTLFPSGLAAGSYPTITRFWAAYPTRPDSAPKYRVAYVRFRLKLEGTDFQPGSVNTKLFYFGYGRTSNDNDAVITLAGSGEHNDIRPRTAFQLRMYVSLGDAGLDGNDLNAATPYNQNVDARPLITVGAWHDVEMVFDVGGVDQRNGAVRIWVDGTKVLSVDGLAVRNSADNLAGNPQPSASALFDMSWAPVFTSSTAKTRDDVILLDRIYVSAKN